MAERIRGRAGQQLRERRLRRTSGLCERCSAAGRTRKAKIVDHVVPLALGGEDVDGNTRNLCDACHREVTAGQFDQQVARGARGIGRSGRPTSPDHPWNAAPPTPGGGSDLPAPPTPDTERPRRAQWE